jgi:hypothetical protein
MTRDCPDVDAVVGLIGALGADAEERLAHLAACDICGAELRRLGLVRGVLEPPPTGVAEAVNATWRALQAAGIEEEQHAGRDTEMAAPEAAPGGPVPAWALGAMAFVAATAGAFGLLGTYASTQGTPVPASVHLVAAMLAGTLAAWRLARQATQ